MTLRASTIQDLPTGEMVLAQFAVRTHSWAMVIRTAADEAGLAFLSYPSDGNEAIFMNYQANVLATGSFLEIRIDETAIAEGLRKELPGTDQPGSKLCILPNGPFLYIAAQRQAATAFDRKFLVDVAGKATMVEKPPSPNDGIYLVHRWSWHLADKPAIGFV